MSLSFCTIYCTLSLTSAVIPSSEDTIDNNPLETAVRNRHRKINAFIASNTGSKTTVNMTLHIFILFSLPCIFLFSSPLSRTFSFHARIRLKAPAHPASSAARLFSSRFPSATLEFPEYLYHKRALFRLRVWQSG